MTKTTRRFASLPLALAAALLAAGASAQPVFTSVYSFDGASAGGPMAGLVQGSDGAFYGTTRLGGPQLLGTAFRFDPATKALTVLHTFGGAPDGAIPYSGLTAAADGTLYGMTYAGGASDLGTVFRVAKDGSLFATVHEFTASEGNRPDDLAMTQAADGALYGAASEGGALGGGTLFRYDPSTGALSSIHDFAASNSAGVDAGLVAGRDGFWYGTTYTGGASGGGSVFRVDPATGSVTTLHDFGGADGVNPVPGALTQASDGKLYGTTQMGGGSYGVVYRLDPASGAFAVLHAFSGVNDGRLPLGGVVEGGDGWIYGTTALGGAGYGTIFRIHLATNAYGNVLWFGGVNGRQPSGNLVRAADGSLWGTTRVGGAANQGTIYRIVTTGDTTAPVISSVTASPDVLKPANGRMVPVAVTVAATDDRDPAPKSRIVSVTCNEPASGDIQVTGDLTVSLRAKRSGKTSRVYTITVQTTDAAGNAATGTVNVTVPK
jgi:uncharacterized repeat protein (TIGR03803 family)